MVWPYYAYNAVVLFVLLATLLAAISRPAWPKGGIFEVAIGLILLERTTSLVLSVILNSRWLDFDSVLRWILTAVSMGFGVAGTVSLFFYAIVASQADRQEAPTMTAVNHRALTRRERVSILRRRYGAYLVDNLIIALPTTIFIFVLMMVADPTARRGPSAGMVLLILLAGMALCIVTLAYFLFRDGFSGQGPGKRLTGVRVVDVATGKPIGIGKSALRNLIFFLPFSPVVELIVANVRRDTRRLGDLLGGTVTVWARDRMEAEPAPATLATSYPPQIASPPPQVRAGVDANNVTEQPVVRRGPPAPPPPPFIRISCPGCGKELKAPSGFAGKRAKCRCGHELVVPAV